MESRSDQPRVGRTSSLAPPAGPELIRIEVGAADGNVRLDRLLAARLAGRSRSQLQRLIKDGRARVGSKAGRPGSIVQAGDVVTLEIPPPRPAQPQPEAIPLAVVYEDADLLVVDKPAGMVVHPAAGHARHTLVNALLHHVADLGGVGGELRPGIVHRLDRGTSGLIVVAKHDRSHAELARQFRCREVEKTYLALVWGTLDAGRQIDLCDRPRSGQPQEDLAALAPTPRGGHPDRERGATGRHVSPGGDDRHGPDAPDSRAPGRRRTSGGR